VDDDPLSNRLVAAALQRAHPSQARTIQDPAGGLEWIEKSQFDLILLDIESPAWTDSSSAGGSGKAQLRNHPRDLTSPATAIQDPCPERV